MWIRVRNPAMSIVLQYTAIDLHACNLSEHIVTCSLRCPRRNHCNFFWSCYFSTFFLCAHYLNGKLFYAIQCSAPHWHWQIVAKAVCRCMPASFKRSINGKIICTVCLREKKILQNVRLPIESRLDCIYR